MLVELPLPIEPELEPVLGDVVLGDEVLGEVVLGEVVLDEEPLELPLMPEEEPLVPPLEDELDDLLKCASHSEREIWPSLFVSTDEKLGVEALPALELGELELDDEPPAAPLVDEGEEDELPLVEDGEDEELPLVAEGDEDEPLVDLSESAAAAASDRAKSAAAVVMVTDLIIEDSLEGFGESPLLPASSVPPPFACIPHVGKLLTVGCGLQEREASNVQEIRCNEAQGEGDGEEEPRQGEGADPQGQGPGQGRALAPHARAEARRQALPGSTQELLKALFAALALAPAIALAQAYPAKPLRVVVPFPPGGGVDIVARAVSEKLSSRLGQPIVIENKPGAGTQIGTDAVAKSAPDGYTLLVGPVGSQAIVQLMHGKRNFDFRRDLAPVARIGHGTIALIVPAASKAQSVKDLVALAKADPGRMTFASSGTGALIHLTGELFKQQAGVDMTHVPYKGTTQILPDLLDGRIDMALDSLPAYLIHLKSGRVRALAVASPQRSAQLPDVPTMAEAGLPGVLSQTDYAAYVPMGTPKEVIGLLHREIDTVLKDEDLRGKLAGQGIRIDPGTPEELAAEFNAELAKWTKVIREANVKPES